MGWLEEALVQMLLVAIQMRWLCTVSVLKDLCWWCRENPKRSSAFSYVRNIGHYAH